MPWEIISITEATELDTDTLRFKPTKLIRYKVGTHGPFTLQVPQAQFTEANVRALLDEQARITNAVAPPKSPSP